MKDGYLEVKVYEPAAPATQLKAFLSTSLESGSRLLAGTRFTNTRKGGCGEGSVKCIYPLAEGHEVEAGDIVKVSVCMETSDGEKTKEGDLYYGMVLDITKKYTENMMKIKTIGLYYMFSSSLYTGYYESYQIDALIAAIFNAVRSDYTWCINDFSGIDIDSPASLGDLEYTFKPVDEIVKQLAQYQGNVEYGVDAEGKFYFRDEDDSLVKIYQMGLNAADIEEETKSRDIINAIFVRCNHVLSSGSLVKYASDSTSISSYKRRAEIKTSPEFKDWQDVDAWAENYLSEKKDPVTSVSFKAVSGDDIRWPSGKVRLLDESGNQLTEDQILGVTYSLQSDHLRVRYKIGQSDAEYEIGDDMVLLRRAVMSVENQEISNDRIQHTGYEEFKQFVEKDAIENGKYNFFVTEFEEEAL